LTIVFSVTFLLAIVLSVICLFYCIIQMTDNTLAKR
jgi:hypothetical protein